MVMRWMSLRGANGVSDEAISNMRRRLLRAEVRRPRNDIIIFLLSSFLLISCSTSTPQTTPQVITVYSTSAAQPWLSASYDCAANQNNVFISRVDEPSSANMVLRVGEPKILTSPAYQIDTEEILIMS